MKKIMIAIVFFISLLGCDQKKEKIETEPSSENQIKPFIWQGANLYFLLTDRFNNGDKSNDISFDRNDKTGIARGFEGGDLRGIIQKIDEGYFTDLGINAIWMTPIVEQIYGSVDEGTGVSYGYHGYWTKDWTNLDPNFGSKEDLKELVEKAHAKGIRIVLDAVINHTGPATQLDPVWPEEWVRTGPKCEYTTYENTTACTLVENLPDIRTENNEEVNLPPQLIKKWKSEGRYDEEMQELNDFFERTGYPRAARFYIIKWLTDYITEFGIDGYRADTVKHTEESVWQEFKDQCDYAFAVWKKNNSDKVLDDNGFFLVGEVYNYNISSAKAFDFGDTKVNYFDYGFDAMINFEFKYNANDSYEMTFSKYDSILNTLEGKTMLNYFSSHDDSSPYDKKRVKSYEAGIKLFLTPGISQVYYGDESARPLVIEGAQGDANLRSFMNWNDIESNNDTKSLLNHYQKLGTFRRDHPSIGAGHHKKISDVPYTFSRSLKMNNQITDKVIVGLEMPKGKKEISVENIFENGSILTDRYSGTTTEVIDGKVIINTNFDIVLLELN